MAFSDNLKAARLHAELTQPQLAAISGVDQGTISRLEADLFEPQYGTLLKLARALGTPLDELVDGRE